MLRDKSCTISLQEHANPSQCQRRATQRLMVKRASGGRVPRKLTVKNSVSRSKTKPSAYLNVWGRRGFTLRQRCSNMRYLHSVQLPSHCGLGKQCGSPTLPPLPKKKTSAQISLSLASYKDLSMNEGFCSSGEDNTHSLTLRRELTAGTAALPQILMAEAGFYLALIG